MSLPFAKPPVQTSAPRLPRTLELARHELLVAVEQLNAGNLLHAFVAAEVGRKLVSEALTTQRMVELDVATMRTTGKLVGD